MEKRSLIIPNHEKLSVRQQCCLLGMNRSTLYYEAVEENEYNLFLMKLMDEEYTRYPFKGALKMTAYLKELEHNVNIKRVRRLLRLGSRSDIPQEKLK